MKNCLPQVSSNMLKESEIPDGTTKHFRSDCALKSPYLSLSLSVLVRAFESMGSTHKKMLSANTADSHEHQMHFWKISEFFTERRYI